MIRKVAWGLYRGPRLRPEEYGYLKQLGVTVVVNLESDDIAATHDALECSDHNIKFLRFNMSEIWPTPADRLMRWVSVIEASRQAGEIIYVHCRRGIDRTGQLIAAWQIRYGGKSFEEAYQEEVSYGHPTIYNVLGWKYVLSKVRKAA